MYKEIKVAALIAAAGSGERFGAGQPKQFIDIGGAPMLFRTASVFDAHPAIDEIYVVAGAGQLELTQRILSDVHKFKNAIVGGRKRQDSVLRGLEAMSLSGNDIVLIHDAARPGVTETVIDANIATAYEKGAAVACVPVKDTIYHVSESEGAAILTDAPPRDSLYAVQTPQGFRYGLIREAHAAAAREGYAATDDGMLAKRSGEEVWITPGDYGNIKITTQHDLPDDIRVGIGFDVHAFAQNRKLILGGVEIPFEKGLMGHSDADVLTHALMDAMLGALSLGDIGQFFPDTDLAFKGISSMALLACVKSKIENAGYRVKNVDTVILAERPKV